MSNAAFLKEYRQVTLETKQVNEMLRRMGHSGTPGHVRGAAYGYRLPGTNDPEAAEIQHQDGLTEELQRLGSRLQEMEPRYQALYKRARHMQERFVMCHYYEMLETDTQIAAAMGVTDRHVRRLRQNLITWLDEDEKSMS